MIKQLASRQSARILALVVMAAGLSVPLQLPAGASAAAPQPVAQAGPVSSCNEYVPTSRTVSSPVVKPGGKVTVTGFGVPGDTVTIRLTRMGGSTSVVLATVVVPPSGKFSVLVTIPSGTPAGRHRITATSAQCPEAAVADVLVRYDLGFCNDQQHWVVDPGAKIKWYRPWVMTPFASPSRKAWRTSATPYRPSYRS